MTAVAIAFWLNQLTQQCVTEMQHALLVVPIVEEVAKYLAIRQAKDRGWIVPAVFIVGETIVKQVTPFMVVSLGTKLPVAMVLYALLNVCALSHFLLYVPVYLWGLRGLPVAIGLHVAWNWYTFSPENADALPLAAIGLACAVLVPLALWRVEDD
jgi:hypothetical protein